MRLAGHLAICYRLARSPKFPSLALDCGPDTASWGGLEPRLGSKEEAKESAMREVGAACRRCG